MKPIGWVGLVAASALTLAPAWDGAASRTSPVGRHATVERADLAMPVARPPGRMALESCLAERKGGRAAAKCAGIVAAPCLRAAEGAGAQAAAACYRREAAGWSSLHEDYRARLSRRFAADLAKTARLREAEDEWAADRVRRCDKAASRIGMPAEPAASACEVKELSRRALYLRLLAAEAGVL